MTSLQAIVVGILVAVTHVLEDAYLTDLGGVGQVSGPTPFPL